MLCSQTKKKIFKFITQINLNHIFIIESGRERGPKKKEIEREKNNEWYKLIENYLWFIVLGFFENE